MAYDDVDRNVDSSGDHSNILELCSQHKKWRTKALVFFREPQQYVEIVNSKLLILARTCEKNEVVCAGKSRPTTTN